MVLKKRRKFGHKESDHAYCPGWVDQHGRWNNGFLCPKWPGVTGVEYCCGTETHRYCCTRPTTQLPGTSDPQTPLLVGMLISATLCLSVAVFLVCYKCHRCPVHRTCRKSCQTGRCRHRLQPASFVNRQFDYVVSPPAATDHYYSGLVLANMNHSYVHQGDPPPSYPSDCNSEQEAMLEEEKQPLTPPHQREPADVIGDADLRVAMWVQQNGMLLRPDHIDDPGHIYENLVAEGCSDPWMTDQHAPDMATLEGFIQKQQRLREILSASGSHTAMHEQDYIDGKNNITSPSVSLKTM